MLRYSLERLMNFQSRRIWEEFMAEHAEGSESKRVDFHLLKAGGPQQRLKFPV